MKPLTIRIDEFQRITGLRRTKTYELINQGLLQTVKIGRCTLVTMASAEALLDSSTRVE